MTRVLQYFVHWWRPSDSRWFSLFVDWIQIVLMRLLQSSMRSIFVITIPFQQRRQSTVIYCVCFFAFRLVYHWLTLFICRTSGTHSNVLMWLNVISNCIQKTIILMHCHLLSTVYHICVRSIAGFHSRESWCFILMWITHGIYIILFSSVLCVSVWHYLRRNLLSANLMSS